MALACSASDEHYHGCSKTLQGAIYLRMPEFAIASNLIEFRDKPVALVNYSCFPFVCLISGPSTRTVNMIESPPTKPDEKWLGTTPSTWLKVATIQFEYRMNRRGYQ
jgi:hypothetical protein